ncbi:hypothetical protein AMATHDRAFT_68490 [Amanita thiersii Skay4041]|uniref:Protein kinase domain-containing protein n=1 Tax=Amanita thiersii Skay4041 TaxID=703135 RepID=A0A2A9NFM9_9AGAR|nr:hypothetical protein AMATHDRAFT_68490 [Amanita thiersii Skay4041]
MYPLRKEPFTSDSPPFVPCHGIVHEGPDVSENVALAQDSLNRHVVIKLVATGTQEFNILSFLKEATNITSSSFSSVMPVLDILNEGEWTFFVMPRWHIFGGVLPDGTVEHALNFAHCMLKGLSLLHTNNIAHKDIASHNILVNYLWAGRDADAKDIAFHRDLCSQGRNEYAIFDFDRAIKLPSYIDRSQYRLPIQYSFEGSHLGPAFECVLAPIDYNPFTYDVFCMGRLLCYELQYITELAPLLAPLLDMMLTPNEKKRFTAEQALEFFEKLRSEMSQEELKRQIPGDLPATPAWHKFDRWRNLPRRFVETWSCYRQYPPSLPQRLLRKLCTYDRGWNLVYNMRLIFRTIGDYILWRPRSRIVL